MTSRFAARGASPLLMALVVGSLAGCWGPSTPSTQPVSGKIFYGDQPMAGAELLFYAEKPAEGDQRYQAPFATADDQGRYEVETFGAADGAPVGVYNVGVRWPQADSEEPSDDPESTAGGDKLQNKFANPATSGISVTIEEGKSELADIRIDPADVEK